MPEPPEETHYNPSIDELQEASLGDGIHIQSGSVDFNGIITDFDDESEDQVTVAVDDGNKVGTYRTTNNYSRLWTVPN